MTPPPPQSSRKYPRAAIDQPGLLKIRARDARTPPRAVPVAIRSISPEGVGLSMQDPRGAATLERRSTVTMDFEVAGHHFVIPGQVVWVARSDRPRGPMDAGVHFTLAAIPSAMRQEYARWIVELLRVSS